MYNNNDVLKVCAYLNSNWSNCQVDLRKVLWSLMLISHLFFTFLSMKRAIPYVDKNTTSLM